MPTVRTNSPYFVIAPGAARNYAIDWEELLPDGVTLATIAADVDPAGITATPLAVSGDLGGALITVPEDATIGAQYRVTLTGTFDSGEVDPRTLYFTIGLKS